MAIITTVSRTRRVQDFANKNLYMGFGRTTAWDDESNPDLPDEEMTEIEEFQFMARIDNIKFITPDEGGSIAFKDTIWSEITEAEIYNQDVVNLYLSVILDYDNFPIIDVRQIGILEEPKDLADLECSQLKYLDTEINSQGYLHYLDNRSAIYRDVNQKELVSVIMEF